MCNMHFFAIFSILFAVTIDSSSAFIFWETRSGCTVLTDVPLAPIDPYYKAELFPNLDAKLQANQNRFDRDLHQVWVDAPDPSVCGYSYGGRCCLNGHFGQQYDFRNFASGDMKKAANEQLWAQAQYNRQPFYQVWADAPERYCKKNWFG